MLVPSSVIGPGFGARTSCSADGSAAKINNPAAGSGTASRRPSAAARAARPTTTRSAASRRTSAIDAQSASSSRMDSVGGISRDQAVSLGGERGCRRRPVGSLGLPGQIARLLARAAVRPM